MIPTSIDKFVASYIKSNPKEKRQDIIIQLKAAVSAKQEGTLCSQCGQQIWAIGTAIAGWNACFTCLTGEADDSGDFEIDRVC
ncbi:hypothetical protein [Aneurinibacillus tyrosinisolvens]|uniref:hypothetical protein n=1 Tax=Aneurinibacillus tyrosinisolvens TaxID=1443435 RepID=UPI00063F29CE|nr:hypothetical protein [Aneurinibacillus tyrosinisolvens]